MSISPNASQKGGLPEGPAGFEETIKKAKGEAIEAQDAKANAFKASPEGKKIEDLLGKEGAELYKRITTSYSQKLGKKELSQDTDFALLKATISDLLKDKTQLKQLGFSLTTENQKKLETELQQLFEGKEGEKEKAVSTPGTKEATSFGELENIKKVPEYDIVERLHEQGHIAEADFKKFREENKDAGAEEIVIAIKKLAETIKDESVKNKVLASFGEDKKIKKNADNEPVTADKIKETDFYKDYGEMINEDRNISDFELKIANKYLSIPKKGQTEKLPEKDAEEERNQNLSMTVNVVGKQVITDQTVEFRQTHAQDIATILDKDLDIKVRYVALERFYNEGEKLKNIASNGTKNMNGTDEKAQKISAIQELLKAGKLKAAQEATAAGTTKQQIAQLEAMERERELPKGTPGDIASLKGGKIDTQHGNDKSSTLT